jgi:ATP/maltotriose-dependent transcriptional regulator MalT
VLAQRGDVEAAEPLSDEAQRLAEDTDFLELQAAAALAHAEVLIAAGDRADAEPLIEEARIAYQRKGNLVAARRTAQLLASQLR